MTKPLYEKIKNDIQRDIMNGTLSVNSQLPTELELSTTYGVSRITSKRALNELEQDGLIYRVQGKGSFVAETNTKKTSEDVFDLLFMMPFPDASNFGDYTSGMLQALQGTPYRLHIQRYDLETQYDDYAGVIFYPIDNHDALEAVFTLYARNIPVVILDKEVSGMPITTVVSNNDQGGYEATKHLMEQGVDEVLFVTSEDIENVSSIRTRYFGYLRALSESSDYTHQNPILWSQSNRTLDPGFIKQLQSKHCGLVCGNDILALTLMNELKHLGFLIPQDVKIVGFDNTQASSYVDPPLTTIAQNFEEIGRVAMSELLSHIQNPSHRISRQVLDVSLIKRKSTD